MNAHILPITELTPSLAESWRRILKTQPEFESPFLHPAFVQVASKARGGVEVAVIDDGGQPIGFFPFQRGPGDAATPVAAGLNEQQAVIAEPDALWSGRELLAACGLKRFEYDHLVGSQADRFGGVVRLRGESPIADLSQGFDNYVAQRRAAGSSSIVETNRKARKLEREIGALRFSMHEESEEAFGYLLEWKARQHQRTGVLDIFRLEWVTRLLRDIRLTRDNGFQANFSVLRADDRPIAVHLGLRTDKTAHVWYPAYDPTLSKYSPGMILFLRWMESLAADGVQQIDFGPGPQRYKRSLMTGGRPVAVGIVERGRAAHLRRAFAHNAKQWLKSSALGRPLKAPARWMLRFRQWLAFRSSPEGDNA